MAAAPQKIEGQMHDPEILAIAAQVETIDMTAAENIWMAAIDGARVADFEKHSVQKILAEKSFAVDAKAWLENKMELCKQNSPGHLAPVREEEGPYYKIIQGLKYDRALLNLAVKATAGCILLTETAAENLWEAALDGTGLTETEYRTIEFIISFYPMSAAARDGLEVKLRKHSPMKTFKFKHIPTIVVNHIKSVKSPSIPDPSPEAGVKRSSTVASLDGNDETLYMFNDDSTCWGCCHKRMR